MKATERKKKILANLNTLKQDFEMLQDETWKPDYDSTQCSIDNIIETIELINN